jgi:hypothetical protein
MFTRAIKKVLSATLRRVKKTAQKIAENGNNLEIKTDEFALFSANSLEILVNLRPLKN